jgi:hypothetical protein
MKPFRTKTTAAAIVAYLREEAAWRTPSEIEEGAGLAWYSPLMLALMDLKENGVVERRLGNRSWGHVPEYRLRTITTGTGWMTGADLTVIRQ